MNVLAQVVVWLNVLANALGSVLLWPISVLPGWLSATIIAAVTGVLLLVAFKYTSNQRAIKAVRSDIKANLLALKLFKDSPAVTLRAQGRVFWGAFRLMVYAIVPMLVMAIPVCLMLGQLALWYQARPLRVGEEALVVVKLRDDAKSLEAMRLEVNGAVETSKGPVRAPSQHAVYWQVKALAEGYHDIVFRAGEEIATKQLAVGDGFMRASLLRPNWSWSLAMLHPWEAPFAPDALVQSIEIEYPQRNSLTSGADYWVVYWFGMSMVAAFGFRPWLNVNI